MKSVIYGMSAIVISLCFSGCVPHAHDQELTRYEVCNNLRHEITVQGADHIMENPHGDDRMYPVNRSMVDMRREYINMGCESFFERAHREHAETLGHGPN